METPAQIPCILMEFKKGQPQELERMWKKVEILHIQELLELIWYKMRLNRFRYCQKDSKASS